ncbi:MAG: replicative DNA helicase [Planctomycetes bacterium]|nr:replicative DNA helicase [Planctomycetota bacterium]
MPQKSNPSKSNGRQPQDQRKFLTSLASESIFFDRDAEMSTLGSMLLNKEICGEVLTILREDDFYDDLNRDAFKVIKELYNEGKHIDEVTVKNRIQTGFGPDNITERIAELIATPPAPMSAPHYARIVKEKSLIRQVVLTCQDIISQSLKTKGGDTRELINYAQQEILKIAEQREISDVRSLADILRITFNELLNIRKIRDKDSRILGLSTGFFELDDSIGGLQDGNLYVIAGRPGMGKTSFAMKIAVNVAQDKKCPVLFTTLEMPGNIIARQMLCLTSKVNSHNLQKGIVSDQEIQSLAISAGDLANAPIYIDDNTDLNIYDYRVNARRMKAKHNIRLLVVDYLQMLSARPAESRQIEITMISHNLKALSKELNIPVIAVAQLNRGPEARPDNRPRLSDLRESGSIEQDADVVMMLYREEYYNPHSEDKNICEVSIQKNRYGPMGEIKLAFLKEYTRFENLAKSV